MRPTVDRYATDSWPIYHRQLTDTPPTVDRHITDSWPIYHRHMTDIWYGLRNRSKLFRGNTNIENWIPAIENWLSISDSRFPNYGIENDTNRTRGRKIECLHRSLILNCLETQHFTCRNLGSKEMIYPVGLILQYLNPPNQSNLWRI